MKEEQRNGDLSFWKSNSVTKNLLLLIWITYGFLTIVNLLFFTQISNLYDVLTISNGLLYLVAQSGKRIFQGHIYLLFTAIIVHIDFLHLFSNSLFLVIYGLRAEESMYNKHICLVFILSAFLGNIFSLIIFNPNTITAGSSGGVFGLLGADLILGHEENNSKSIWVYIAIGFFFLILSAGPNINFFAHSIGIIMGLFLTRFVFKSRINDK